MRLFSFMPPEYEYINPETNEKICLWQSVHDEHSYTFAGVKWDRVWTTPQIAMDTKVDPFSERQFLEKTSKGGKLGDLWDRASEMREMREEKTGQPDEVVAGYEKQKGKKLPKKRSKEVKIEIG